MKKLFLFLTLLFVGMSVNAQYTPSNNLNYVKLIKTPPTGTTTDQMLVYDGADQFVKMRPVDTDNREAVNDVNKTIIGTANRLIAYTAITADRTVTLPPATTANQRIWITDESGLCSNARRIIVAPNGSDVIGGDAFSVINFPNGSGYLESNGAGKWNIISTTAVQFSAGVNTLPTITDNGNGSVTLGTGVYSLFANANGVGRPKAYQIAGGTFTFVDGSTNYIYADYNTTTGAVTLQQTTTETPLNDLTQTLVYAAYRQGTTLHPRNFDTQGIALSNKINRSIYRTQRVRFEEGGVLVGESASPAVRTITISAGTVWVAATEQPLSALTSAANTCYHVIQTSPGVWTTSTVVTQYNNTQYNTSSGLQTLNNNEYGVNWLYRSIGTDNDMAIILGGASYTLGQAQSSQKPTNLPPFMRHMELVGRIIVLKNATTATQIDNVSSTFFTASGVTDHNALNNLQTAQAGVTYGHITDAAQSIFGNKTLKGITTFGESSGDQSLWNLPGLNTLSYKETAGLDYDINVNPNNPNSFFWKNNEGIVHQALYFGDGSAETNIFGISCSLDSGVTWHSGLSVNGSGKVGILNNNPIADLDVKGNIRASGVINSNTGFSVSKNTWTLSYTSPDLGVTLPQGYTSDGDHHFQFGTSRIAKYDFSYSTLLVNNTTPFTGISGGVNHIGDGCYLNGLLYVPMYNETLAPASFSAQKIAVFDPATLALVTTYDISAQSPSGGDAIATDGTILYVFEYYGTGNRILKYSLTGTYLGTITIANPLPFIQGASFYKGLFYISDQTDLYTISLDGTSTTYIMPAINAPLAHRGEGLEMVNGELRWVVAKLGGSDFNTYFYNPQLGTTKDFEVNALGKMKASAIGVGVLPTEGINISGTTAGNSRVFIGRSTTGATGRYSIGIQNGDNQFGFIDEAQGGLTRVVISKDGNFGIGYSVITDPILTGNKLSVDGKGYFNGTVRVSNGVAATDAVNKSQLDLKADINSQTLTGDPKAPTAAAGDNDTSIATTAFVFNNARPYKVYTAILSQSGTNAPTATVLENTTGQTFTWSYLTVGQYKATYSSTLDNNKTAVTFINGAYTGNFSPSIFVNSGDVTVHAKNGATATDGILSKNFLEIRIYP